jgi:hypothetical protein
VAGSRRIDTNGPSPVPLARSQMILSSGEVIDGQEAVAGLFDSNRVIYADRGQQIGELAARNEHGKEFEMFGMRGGARSRMAARRHWSPRYRGRVARSAQA